MFLVSAPTYRVTDLEDEIEKLEASAEPSASDKSRLTSVKNELAKIMQKKDEYVKDHPEQRKLVYRPHKQEKGEDQKQAPPTEQKRNLFNKHGLPRHPERSIYYDPVMNPYGVPPPGMPYIERRECLLEVILTTYYVHLQLSPRAKWTVMKTLEVGFLLMYCILFCRSVT